VDAVGLVRLKMRPVRLRFAHVDLADGDEATAIQSLMIQRCEVLGVRPVAVSEGLELPLSRSAG
jgi:hypothetical protein